MCFKPGDQLRWRGQLVTFVAPVAPPNGQDPPALADVFVPAAWVRQSDNRVVPAPLEQLTYDSEPS